MADSIKTHQNIPNLQGIEQAWYCLKEDIATWPYYRKSDNTYTDDFLMATGKIFKRLDSDYPAYQYQEVQKTDASGSYKEQTIVGFTHSSFKAQTNIYQGLINKQIIVLFKLPDGTFRIMGNELQGARIVANTDSETVGANNAPGENYKVTYSHRLPCPYYEGTATVDSAGNLIPFYVAPPILEDADAGDITVGLALMKLYPSYSGPAMIVRRSSDDALATIGWGLDGQIDTAAIFDHVGASFDGYVHSFFDQGPNGFNFVETTNGNQPRICSAGVMDINPLTGMYSLWFGSSKQLACPSYVEPSDECIMYAFGTTGFTGESGWRTSNWSSSDHVLSIHNYYLNLYLRCINGGGSITPANTGFGKQILIWEVDGAAGGVYYWELDGDTVAIGNLAPFNTHITAKDPVTTQKIINFNNTHVTAIIAMNKKTLSTAIKNRFKTTYL